MKKYLKYFSTKGAILGGALALMLICYSQQKENAKLRTQVKQPLSNIDSLVRANDSLQRLSDSLYDENFPCQIELGRYQVAFQIFAERNPKAAEQYAEIISSETE